MYEANKRWREANREKVKKTSRSWDLRRLYGMTLWQFDDLRAQQGNRCGICNEELGAGRRVHVDHDPTTGAVRGLLCIKCNSGLGKLGDSIVGLERALAYLKRDRPTFYRTGTKQRKR